MTMHLVGPYLTTTNYNKKRKTSKSQKLAKALSDHEEWLRRVGASDDQLNKKLPRNKKGQRVGINEIPDYTDTKPTVKLSNTVGNGAKVEEKRYTGTEIAGIAVTHKSNLVPIRKDNKQAAIDVAQMRR